MSPQSSLQSIDKQILELVRVRAQFIRQQGKITTEYHHGETLHERVTDLPSKGIREILESVRQCSLAASGKRLPVISVIGPSGSFSYLAAKQAFGAYGDLQFSLSNQDGLADVIQQRVDLFVLAVANSFTGPNTMNLELLSEVASNNENGISICGEVTIQNAYSLYGNSEIGSIRTVMSHPEGFAQCRQELQQLESECGRHFDRVLCESTSRAAEEIALRRDKSLAALCSDAAGRTFHLTCVKSYMSSVPYNQTRFVAIGTTPTSPSGNDKTAVFVTIPDAPGSLHNVLGPMARNDVNVTSLYSVRRRHPWEQCFYLEFSGHLSEAPLKEILAEMNGSTDGKVAVLGSFPNDAVQCRV